MSDKILIDFKSSVPIFQQVVNEIERQILTGKLNENDFLMSVREFAVSQTINPNTVAKAYQQLQAMGLVESIRGKGLSVRKLKEKAAENRRSEIIDERIHDLLDLAQSLKLSSNDVIELIKSHRRKK